MTSEEFKGINGGSNVDSKQLGNIFCLLKEEGNYPPYHLLQGNNLSLYWFLCLIKYEAKAFLKASSKLMVRFIMFFV